LSSGWIDLSSHAHGGREALLRMKEMALETTFG
jgi:hypothetical protein